MSAEKNLIFGRMMPAMVTPFDSDLELDLNRAQELAVRLVDGGSDSLMINGTTGESPTVFYPQKIELFRAIIEAVGDRVPVLANVGDNCTADTIKFACEVEKLGVDGLMLVVPYYNKPPQEGLYQHFKTIAGAVELPIIMYNIPGRCVINMEAQTTLRLAHDVENIVAIKEASGDMSQIQKIIDEAPDDFMVFSGDDEVVFEIMKRGGTGVISTIGNVAPQRIKEIVELCAAGDFDRAWEAHVALQPLMKELFVTANPILVKESLKLAGFSVGGVRLPLVDATPEQSAHLAQVMREVGVL
ncbi:MAG: 4-hydroxy-tetrahydrodipicolinate synthase [Eggerthellaceae bacterium]|nr:4-hydroxy-tetrahydrodipicolinate synthase [Eggerthellaceae bacterium]MDR2722052.1 4-hydroxy-tetrahydrodipicolinate synthase [Coriobacteriaceae bacterium]